MTNTDTTNIAVNTMEDLETVCGLCADSGEAVELNFGTREIVMMDKKKFNDIEFKLFEADVICGVLKAQQDIIEGRVIEGDDFFEQMSRKYGV